MVKPNCIIRTVLFLLILYVSLLSAQEKRILAILPFTNMGSSETDWIARGIEEILYNKFSNLQNVTIYEKETLKRILTKNKIQSQTDLTIRKAFALGKETGTDVLLTGYYKSDGTSLTINFRLISTYTGGDIYNQLFEGTLQNIFKIHKKAILEMLDVMALPITNEEKLKLSKSSTYSIQAFRNYCQAYIEFQKGSSMDIVASLFKRALEQDPNFWEAQYNLGVIYYNFDKYDQAKKQFESVIQKNPDFYKPYYGLGVIYYIQRKYELAVQQFEKVLQLNPTHDRTLYYLGRAYVRLNSIEKGLEYLHKAVEVNPNYAPTHYQIGMANMRRGWYKTAIISLKKSLQLYPNNARAHNALGECYYHLQRFDDAIYHYQKALELRKDYATVYFNLGNTFYKKGALQEIVDAYLEILETRYSQNSTNQGNISIVEDLKKLKSKESGQSGEVYRKMIQAYRNALKYDPKFFEASFNLALTYENIGKLDSAEYYYRLTLDKKPTLVRANMRLGRLMEREGRYDEALKYFKEVVKVEPSYFASTPRLGEPYRYINIIDEVLKEYQMKYDENPNDPETLLVLARIFSSLGRFGQAEQYYKLVVQIDPGNREANQELKNLRLKKKKL